MGLPVSRRAAARAAWESSLDSKERAVQLTSQFRKPAWWWEGRAAGGGLVLPLRSPPLGHLFEIYEKIFGPNPWAGWHRWAAWEGGRGARALTILAGEGAGMEFWT